MVGQLNGQIGWMTRNTMDQDNKYKGLDYLYQPLQGPVQFSSFCIHLICMTIIHDKGSCLSFFF